MNRNLAVKSALIIGITLLAVYILIPPDKTLKTGIDISGGTSLIYEIDTTGLKADEKRNLSQNMINVLQRRIDPGTIQGLKWIPQGDTRLEIQMPLASANARAKRQKFEVALTSLMDENINPSTVMRILKESPEQREEFFKRLAANSPQKLEILNKVAEAYDQYYQLRAQSDELDKSLKDTAEKIKEAGIDVQQLKPDIKNMTDLGDEKLTDQLISKFNLDANEPESTTLELLKSYVKTYAQWSEATNQLTEPETGKIDSYNNAKRQLDRLTLTEDQIITILEEENKSKRESALEQIKKDFANRTEKIDALVKAYDEYRYGGKLKGKLMGRLDDPDDLKRMLKGSGVLEFRILPTTGHPNVDSDKIKTYVEQLKTKGPKYTPDNDYVWCEVEKETDWISFDKNKNAYIKVRDGQNRFAIVEQFGNKYYVLTSNKPDECMLHSLQNPWKLTNASTGTDYRTGRRAIDFVLDSEGGRRFANVTAKNLERPLCILLDNLAISAPNINSVISTQGQISGNFTSEEQIDMVNKLNAGRLPARLIEPPVSERTIGPSIGTDNLKKGIKSGLIGLALVILGMAIYYTLSGCIADAALLMNLLFTMAIMSFIKQTFTLPGIAGAILTIGMSVDANVLIFERIREEQQKGMALWTAIKNGYQKAFSAIFDSNLTTVIAAAVLYWIGSEDIKGFAIVLMLGLGSNLFTAVFVTRVVFDILLATGIIKEHLMMMHLFQKPKINWMAFRPAFFTISAVLAIGGLVVFFTRDNSKSNKYDIEFTGGTSVVINLKPDRQLARQDVEDRIKKIGTELGNPAIVSSNVWSVGKPEGEKASGEKIFRQYEITTTETNKTICRVTFPANQQQTAKTILSKVGNRLTDATVTQVAQAGAFEIKTSQTNPTVVTNAIKELFPDAEVSQPQVQETINNAIIEAFGDDLDTPQNLEPQITSAEQITEKLVEAEPQLADCVGGIKIVCSLGKSATIEEISKRFMDIRFKPDTRNLPMYNFKFLKPDLTTPEPNQPMTSFVYVSANEEFATGKPDETGWKNYEETEKAKIMVSMQLAESLPRVTQISPSVGSEAKTRALLAIILSLFALLVYIWFRFGNLRYGIGAAVTLFHDTCITVGLVSACTYIAGTSIGQALLIGDFKINLAMIAAFLTLIGYSLNDTIVIYDRIRENRKKGTLTARLISDSINDTLSRTLLTGVTTLIVVWIMYIFGGEGLRGFNFAMGTGIIIGTYSSIAISAPMLLVGIKSKSSEKS